MGRASEGHKNCLKENFHPSLLGLFMFCFLSTFFMMHYKAILLCFPSKVKKVLFFI